jgi:hypothetical protein
MWDHKTRDLDDVPPIGQTTFDAALTCLGDVRSAQTDAEALRAIAKAIAAQQSQTGLDGAERLLQAVDAIRDEQVQNRDLTWG